MVLSGHPCFWTYSNRSVSMCLGRIRYPNRTNLVAEMSWIHCRKLKKPGSSENGEAGEWITYSHRPYSFSYQKRSLSCEIFWYFMRSCKSEVVIQKATAYKILQALTHHVSNLCYTCLQQREIQWNTHILIISVCSSTLTVFKFEGASKFKKGNDCISVSSKVFMCTESSHSFTSRCPVRYQRCTSYFSHFFGAVWHHVKLGYYDIGLWFKIHGWLSFKGVFRILVPGSRDSNIFKN